MNGLILLYPKIAILFRGAGLIINIPLPMRMRRIGARPGGIGASRVATTGCVRHKRSNIIERERVSCGCMACEKSL